jgi:hypothetical protein
MVTNFGVVICFYKFCKSIPITNHRIVSIKLKLSKSLTNWQSFKATMSHCNSMPQVQLHLGALVVMCAWRLTETCVLIQKLVWGSCWSHNKCETPTSSHLEILVNKSTNKCKHVSISSKSYLFKIVSSWWQWQKVVQARSPTWWELVNILW